MAKSDIAELRGCDEPELLTRLAEAKQELFNMRFQVVTGQNDNTSAIGQVKKNIARIHTLLRQREIEAAEKLEKADG
jgi:large subunit ribosomal protein L29